jgi:hypothetical protein
MCDRECGVILSLCGGMPRTMPHIGVCASPGGRSLCAFSRLSCLIFMYICWWPLLLLVLGAFVQFPSRLSSNVARFVAFVAGSFVAVLLMLTLIDSTILLNMKVLA